MARFEGLDFGFEEIESFLPGFGRSFGIFFGVDAELGEKEGDLRFLVAVFDAFEFPHDIVLEGVLDERGFAHATSAVDDGENRFIAPVLLAEESIFVWTANKGHYSLKNRVNQRKFNF